MNFHLHVKDPQFESQRRNKPSQEDVQCKVSMSN